ncbi:hypothetical protein B0T25DRAFT_574904 [Lasiosphaeria hispida]|uniref:Uncharacterized protein n=1 Tax=Lasiosphaeria hispida TaxID=260671 RepID=A0AAJ0H4Q7_9PEZI|nr:hypothetical protein B0T25DRAFT_574904 [Lasiosphaeria hispida]
MGIEIFSLGLLAALLLNATGGAAGLITLNLPSDLPDGHYIGDGTLDTNTGFAKFTYVGAIDYDYAVINYTAATTSAESSAAIMRRATVNCNGRAAGDYADSVQKEFAKYWNGKTFSGAWARTTQGGSQA